MKIKKYLYFVLALCLISVFSPTNVFAKNSDNKEANYKIIQQKEVKLKSSNKEKCYKLKIYEDKYGRAIYGFSDVDPEYIDVANEYLSKVIKQAEKQSTEVWITNTVGTETYANDYGYDDSASAYTWGRVKPTYLMSVYSEYDCWGGSSGYWSGSNFNQMALQQSTTINKLSGSIGWPPGVDGNGSVGTWSSLGMSENPLGAPRGTFDIKGVITSIVLEDGADIYINGSSRIYKPRTYVKFKNN